MKFPLAMLRDFVETALDAEGVGELLTMAGFELEGIEIVENEPVLDVSVMSNRGDGLSVFGLAREVLAKDPDSKATELYRRATSRFADVEADASGDSDLVRIETEDCNRYACLMYSGVTNGPAPEGVQSRLRQAGMRPISLLVDLTNYILLEMGQPLHAFDQDKLAEGRIVVRKARRGEKLKTLNGEDHELRDDQMMICDANGPVAAAGIMGGLDTEVSAGTKNLLLESAHFDHLSVRRTRKQMGLSTEASYRFERSVDPETVVAALRRFAELLAESDRGAKLEGFVDHYPGMKQPGPLDLRVGRARVLLGMYVSADEANRYLTKLGFEVQAAGDNFGVTPPSWRPDVLREEDLIEELGRVHGYEKIPELLPQGTTTQGRIAPFEAFLDRLRDAAVRSGFAQIISHTLSDAHPLEDPSKEHVMPRNPGSPDIALLRNSTWSSLAEASRKNGGRDVHLFELGKVFARSGSKYEERWELGLLSGGSLNAPHWQKALPIQADFFTLKGVMQQLGQEVHIEFRFASEPADARLHPTKQAAVYAETDCVGQIGQIHPEAAEEAGLPAETVLALVRPETLFKHYEDAPKMRPISRNPAVRRDISFLIEKSVPYEKLRHEVVIACGQELEKEWLFDVYEGQGIPEDKHSLSIALQLRKMGENFTDEEANQVRERAVQALERLGAIQR